MQNKYLTTRPSRGIVLLALLLTLALMGIALMGAVSWWSLERQRENEEDLLFIGNQYRLAIERYYYATPGNAKALPMRLDELIEDQRFPIPVRHLRRLYLDPMTGEPFELIHIGEQIHGVASTSQKKAIKRSGFFPPYTAFEVIETYDQWKFLFTPPRGRKAISVTPKVAAKQEKNQGVKP
ncbi:type II secretion system protein [Glaciimonas sp. CA11.2]|uniref:type II secretion system protein n=1 Tax=Glaciimonas sp. CA11.2 TaxID=3048601 RepID=UPI002AB3B568|nr:type II secretion system protein [Glaciimonas sp. CA11.2]MDY7545100.1 type II secretion system protein [Glaciimonas sp. CA11.2]MEB0162415.1 type II secretion system protein [Glaciimonas sp. CA11.2]